MTLRNMRSLSYSRIFQRRNFHQAFPIGMKWDLNLKIFTRKITIRSLEILFRRLSRGMENAGIAMVRRRESRNTKKILETS
jgi:hypothetical protein